jgi:hypothetical protein
LGSARIDCVVVGVVAAAVAVAAVVVIVVAAVVVIVVAAAHQFSYMPLSSHISLERDPSDTIHKFVKKLPKM